MRLLFLSLYFYPARRYGGPIVSAAQLCRGLAARGFEVRALTTDADGPDRLAVPAGWRAAGENLRIRYCRRLGGPGGRLGELVAPGLLAVLPRQVAYADAVYVWGILVWPLPALAALCRLFGKPLVISPRGMLFPEALAAKSGKKRLFLAILRRIAGARAVYHVTSEEEAQAVRERFPGARTIEVPNGVEIPSELPAAEALDPGRPYLLFLGRLHPHKQIEMILSAYARWIRSLEGESPADLVDLYLVGSGDEGYRRSLEEAAERAGVAPWVRFLPHVEGLDKARLLAGAEGLILASKSENFGLSVAEALAHGAPCVVTRTAPWAGLERERCGFWVEDGPESLAGGIGRLMALSAAERRAWGARGRAWMIRDFSQDGVADRMAAALTELTQPSVLPWASRHAG
jgi:glycosyltransferase involved in cell wall biosynthesis